MERRKEVEVIIDKNELYSLIKKAVREVLEEETLEFFLKNIPLISKEEMEDIEKLYGKPSAGKEAAYSETIEV
jgi:2-phospho-L-lactate guanylyltransferase (CobY/MobA/RfbA family)